MNINHLYAHSESLVSTDWVAEHLPDPHVRIIESNEDVLLYASFRTPSANLQLSQVLGNEGARNWKKILPEATFRISVQS
jgi:hypothetical protein